MIFIAATGTESCLRWPGSTPPDRPLRSQWTGAARPEGRAAKRAGVREVPAPELLRAGADGTPGSAHSPRVRAHKQPGR
eukprot:3248418-Alexandrium_andersonii.AAC.1